jgi:hypothetical protein
MDGKFFKHIKSGNTYRVLMQALLEKDCSECVVYRKAEGDSRIWVRPLKEFLEKFEPEGN